MARSFAIARTVLDGVAAWYADPGNNLPEDQALPERRYVTLGLPPADCESFVVTIDGRVAIDGSANVTATPTDRDEVAWYMRATIVTLWIFRCAPTLTEGGTPPDVDVEEAFAETIANDLERFELALHEQLEQGELPGCGGIAWIASEMLTHEGAMGGGLIRLQISEE